MKLTGIGCLNLIVAIFDDPGTVVDNFCSNLTKH